MTEDQLHRQVVSFLRLALPSDAVMHHSPGESSGSVAWHVKRKALGFCPGWPDIEIIYQGTPIFIELKGSKGRLSKAQKECHNRLIDAGAVVTGFCQSVEEVEEFLRYVIPLKARLP